MSIIAFLHWLFTGKEDGDEPRRKPPKRRRSKPILAEEFPDRCTCGGGEFICQDGAQICKACELTYRSTLADAVREGKCPDCGGALYEGPSGGAAMNIACKKGHRFWFADMFGHVKVKRLDPIEPW